MPGMNRIWRARPRCGASLVAAGLLCALGLGQALYPASAAAKASEEKAISTDSAAPRARTPGERRSETGLPIPRFVSLRSGEVNLRAGPGERYPVSWVFVREGLPVEITAEYETWRRIRDNEGTEGWVHQSLLSGRRMVLITGGPVILRKAPQRDAAPLAKLAVGVLARAENCKDAWCRLSVADQDGYAPQKELYGVYPTEVFE